MTRIIVILLVIVFGVVPTSADNVGKLIYAQGRAQLVRNLKPQILKPGSALEGNDTMRVQIGARMKSILNDDSIIMIWDDTEIRLEEADINLIAGKRIISIEQLTGHLRLVVSEFLASQSEVIVRTPNARIKLESEGDVVIKQGVQGDNTEIIAIDGRPEVEHIFSEFGGSVVLEPQQTSIVGSERAPSEPIFMDRDSFDQLLDKQTWILPQPVPDWDDFFGEKLEAMGVRSFGRVRRLAAKPLTPIRTVVEGLSEQNLPDRPGDVRPEPKGRVVVDVRCSSCADGEFGGIN